MALDDYFSNPSQDCLARLFDAVNAIDLSGAPTLSRSEKLIMRSSERKDIFVEKFANLPSQPAVPHHGSRMIQHKSTPSTDSHSSFEDGLLMRSKDNKDKPPERSGPSSNGSHGQPGSYSPSDSSFSLGGSAVWVGDESGLDLAGTESSSTTSSSYTKDTTITAPSRKRRSTGASSSSSHLMSHFKPSVPPQPFPDHARSNIVKDTHFYHTTVAYKDHHLPIKMPLGTFPEEVGDVSVRTATLCLRLTPC